MPGAPRSPIVDRSAQTWIAALCLLSSLVIVLHSWAFRFFMNPDGVSYLDMTDLLLRGDYRPLAHSYWSPLYPCLLALLLKVSSASSETEDVIVHLGNGLVGLAALASFTFLVVQWQHLRVANQKTDLSLVAFRLRLAFAYLMFLWATIQMIGLALVTPDLCVAALVYLAAALCCRMAVGSGGWGTSALLGAVASLAYFGKAAMAPLGAALLVLLAIPRISPLLRRKHLIAAAPIFAAAVGAHVFVVSRQTHHFSFAEVGRLAYAWLVGREIPAYVGWTGDPPGTGPPIHAPRVLSVKPKVLEFRNTVPGTYPLWYDPAYFHDGLRTHFDWRKEVPTLYQSLFNIRRVQQPNFNPLVAGLCVLWLLAVRSGGAGVDFSKPWLILWPLAAFSMFALVLIEGRFIAPFLVLFWISVYDAVSPGSLASSAGSTSRHWSGGGGHTRRAGDLS